MKDQDFFFNLDNLEEYEVAEGIILKPIYYTDEFMAILFIIKKEVPIHKHSNVQVGMILDGKALFKIGNIEKEVVKNDFYFIPSNVEHRVRVLNGPLYALDIFIPAREDYKKFFRYIKK